ncbi:TPA: hypothetical protein DIU22_05400 [Candidatus Woesebacteria bacterium]|nr:hypothetical protein [Candidatus Woesebacteria bacterium]HLA23010.1 FkbM family methyltransferase [Candidatus Nanoarchaeia archaeon]
MIKIIESLSWIPYKTAKMFGKRKNDFLILDLEKIGIKKRFKFNTTKTDEGLSSQLKTFGFREPVNLEYYHKFVEKNDKVLDIGANIGLFTILSENAKEIICVEPLKQAIPLLKKNINDNNLMEKTKIINAAVGKKGKLIISVDEQLNLSRIVSKKTKNSYEVKSMELMDLTKRYDSNLLRMDVEGYEYEILFEKLPKRINKISIEFHTLLLGKEKVSKLLNYLEKEGFKLKYFIEDLPIRLYPFFNILKKFGFLRRFTYVKRNISINECSKIIGKGRAVKYLFLQR